MEKPYLKTAGIAGGNATRQMRWASLSRNPSDALRVDFEQYH
jgi:hypothetical protein